MQKTKAKSHDAVSAKVINVNVIPHTTQITMNFEGAKLPMPAWSRAFLMAELRFRDFAHGAKSNQSTINAMPNPPIS
ncbi:hypothetical protein ACTXOF_18075, partial [Glutamicibacter arilaitensis]